VKSAGEGVKKERRNAL